MASKVVMSGKHPLTVRIGQDDYKMIGRLTVKKGMSVKEWIAETAIIEARRQLKRMGRDT